MSTRYFVDKHSVVREIWGKSDTILFIFAGAAAEFALNKAVDWLYFTGRLPAAPIDRLFSTVSYARTIVFSEEHVTVRAIESMNAIHAQVEAKRGLSIPDWAYRDVLFMLVDYSIRSFEALERKMTLKEKEEVFRVFTRVGSLMKIRGLPESFTAWEIMRRDHLSEHLSRSNFTNDLFRQYRKHLGFLRYQILLETQSLVAPPVVRKLLGLRSFSIISPVIAAYKLSKRICIDRHIRSLVMPSRYRGAILSLDRA